MDRQDPGDVDDSWSSLFEFLPIGAYRSTPDGRPLRANPALVRLNSFESEAEQVTLVRDIATEWYVKPGRRDEFKQLIERDGRVVGFESEIHRYKTRERIWVRENAHGVREADGRLRYYEGTVEDITDVVLTRQALGQAESRLRELVSLVPGVLYRLVLLPDGGRRFTFVSEQMRDLYGVSAAEVLRKPDVLSACIHPADRDAVAAEVARVGAHGGELDLEFRIRTADTGRERWVRWHGSAADRTADGLMVRAGVVTDITARKLAQLALQRHNELWLGALQASGDGVWDWRVQDGVEILSPQCKALFGFEPHELPDTPDALDDRTHPDDRPQMGADREAHFHGRTARYVNEHRVRCKDGSWKWILSRGLVIERDAQGRPLRMIGTHTDVTAAKQAAGLRVERDNAAAADRAKSQFLSRVSHELRTPLNAVLGFAQLLEMDPGGHGERQRGWVQQVLVSGRHLQALLEDVLDLSSLQSGRLAMVVEPVPLAAVVDEAWTMLAAAAIGSPATALRFEDRVAGSGCHVLADRKRLKQIVGNLLSNAVKYNRPGGWVRVSVVPVPDTARAAGTAACWELQVADSGRGLDEGQRARLFNPFDRLGAERGSVPGTGLGLALTRQLVEALDGEILLDSTPGEGSTFRVRLPAADSRPRS